MQEEYDWDIYEIFEEQISIQLSPIEKHIFLLNDATHVGDSLDELFRYFHSYKASSAYLKLDPITELVSKVEIVLSSLREKKQVVQESILDWLFDVKDQMHTYTDELSLRQTVLSPVPKNLLNRINITSSYVSPMEKLKTLSLVYVDKNKARAKKVVPLLKKYTNNVTYSSDTDNEDRIFRMQPYDILLTNLDKDNHQLISLYKNVLPIIAIFSKISPTCARELLKNGMSHTIEAPLNISKIQRELLSIVRIFHSATNILIDNKKIHTFIQTLQPLPNTIFQIMQICDDDDLAISDLIKTVKTDPIISANILKVANSPTYGSIQLKTIDQAVSRFGKQAIKALTMSGAYKSLGTIDLSAYGINEEDFSRTSMRRMSLMLKWYAKVSIADLSILSSTALLSNIGQLLLSKELVAMYKDDTFKDLCKEFTVRYAEESLLHTTTNGISSQILRYWKLAPEIIDVIEYCDNPASAPKEIQKLCAANHVVCSLVSSKGEIEKEIPDDLLVFLAEYSFDPAPLNKALQSLL
ncbi:HDOD domain-containing protein [Sulfurimonas sp. SAG-AH-194-I05]|nr:HDOD domain-containing protein [Sulfurimonas sp. SAG-AH-194-I05]MDF1875575.1 HDOD domain-containing protein [Sulfurimonas sp. SAG-AH-194-I05]